eukprot:SM000290S10886  [mRNA]  locus=s290:107220:110651:+ [translate_table: standard]
MSGAFNSQILSEKLAKLNNSQQSIETLSHWCIFHRKRAAQVVATWEAEFAGAPRDKRVSYLYLANDILQNSRRKGPEFVNEFWRALPPALQAVAVLDDVASNIVGRLIDIWDDRKVFSAVSAKDKNLRDLLLGPVAASAPFSPSAKSPTPRSPRSVAAKEGRLHNLGPLEKLAEAHGIVQEGIVDEEAALTKLAAALAAVQGLEKDAGKEHLCAMSMEEVVARRAVVNKHKDQLKVFEERRSVLVSLLQEALHTQESKLDRLRRQLRAAGVQVGHANGSQPDPSLPSSSAAVKGNSMHLPEANGVAEGGRQAAQEEQARSYEATVDVEASAKGLDPARVAAEVAAKLAASSSSAAVLSSVLSSLAAENKAEQRDSPMEASEPPKRPRMDMHQPQSTLAGAAPGPPPQLEGHGNPFMPRHPPPQHNQSQLPPPQRPPQPQFLNPPPPQHHSGFYGPPPLYGAPPPPAPFGGPPPGYGPYAHPPPPFPAYYNPPPPNLSSPPTQ